MEREPRETTFSRQAAEIRLTREGNVVTIEKPEGKYSIIYGPHKVATKPEDLPPDLDGLDLEQGLSLWTKNPLGHLDYCRKRDKQYSSIFPLLEKRETPVIFTDVTSPFFELFKIPIDYSMPLGAGIALGECLLGIKILRRLSRDFAEERISRRDFLSIGGRIVLAGWLTSPAFSLIVRFFSSRWGRGEDLTAGLIKLSTRLHPEDFLFLNQFRNHVIAYKQQWLMEKKNKKHLGTVIGAGHCNLEDVIQSPLSQKYNFLEAFAPALPYLVKPAESFYQIAIFNFDGADWQVGEILEVPELKQLMEQAIYSWGS